MTNELLFILVVLVCLTASIGIIAMNSSELTVKSVDKEQRMMCTNYGNTDASISEWEMLGNLG